MTINYIGELSLLSTNTKPDRFALWAKMGELGLSCRTMYLYSVDRLKAVTEKAQASVDAKKREKQAEKGAAKAAKENAYREFVRNDERAKTMFAKMKAAKTQEEKDEINTEAEKLQKTLKTEFNEQYRA